jgi:AraC-like DNA-binding protein
MMGTTDVLNFSTDDFPDRDKVSRWREEFARGVVNMDVEPLGDKPFRSVSQIHLFPDLKIWSCQVSAAEVTRTRALAANGEDSVVLAIIRQGRTRVAQKGQEIYLGQGSAVLWSSQSAGVFHNPGDMDIVTMAFPRESLKRTVGDLDRVLLKHIPASTEVLQLLRQYADMLRAQSTIREPRLRALAASHVQDLTALVLGATREGEHAARAGGLRAARLQAVKTDIMANISVHGLNVDSVAARNKISSRYIRALFETEQTSFTAFVREQRLLVAHRILNSPASRNRAVSAIAFDCGFGDLSYFNNSFRRRFGATPTEVRAAAFASWGCDPRE